MRRAFRCGNVSGRLLGESSPKISPSQSGCCVGLLQGDMPSGVQSVAKTPAHKEISDLGMAQELLRIGRSDGVVPLWQGCLTGDSQFPQSLDRRFDFKWVVPGVQVRADFQ